MVLEISVENIVFRAPGWLSWFRRPTHDFSSGHDLIGGGFKLAWGSVLSRESPGDSFSLPVPLPLLMSVHGHAFFLSLSNK